LLDSLFIIKPFLFIKNKRLFISSESFSVFEKNRHNIFLEGSAARPVGCGGVTALCR
jgi:hypothetical protein